MELSLKDRTELYNEAKTQAQYSDWALTLLRAMNPKKMSQSDIDLCEDILNGVR